MHLICYLPIQIITEKIVCLAWGDDKQVSDFTVYFVLTAFLISTLITNFLFISICSDLEKNNITRIAKTDFSGLKNLRVL